VLAARPGPGELGQPFAFGDEHEVPGLPVLRGRSAPAGFTDLVEMIDVDRPVGEGPDVPPGTNCFPGLHELACALLSNRS
jgi:hypothetical protein